MKALAALRPKVNVTGVCALAHNAIGERAYFPGDVYEAYNGTTVEILSTDAEGRLVLADAISYCKETRSPSRMCAKLRNTASAHLPRRHGSLASRLPLSGQSDFAEVSD